MLEQLQNSLWAICVCWGNYGITVRADIQVE
jgi:hypothetical protein